MPMSQKTTRPFSTRELISAQAAINNRNCARWAITKADRFTIRMPSGVTMPMASRTVRRLARMRTTSGDGQLPGVLGSRPGLAAQDVVEAAHRVPDVDIARIQGGEAETHQVGRPKVADHALVDQGPHHPVRLRVADGDVRPAQSGVARGGDLQVEPIDRVHQADEEVTQRLGLPAGRWQVDLEPYVDADLKRRHGQDGRRPRHLAPDPGSRAVARLEAEWVRMAHPAGERRAQGLLPAPGDEQVGGGAGAAV